MTAAITRSHLFIWVDASQRPTSEDDSHAFSDSSHEIASEAAHQGAITSK
jgi:hypothetical protein